MANSDVFKKDEDILPLPVFGQEKGQTVGSRGLLLEKKIDFLESLASKWCTTDRSVDARQRSDGIQISMWFYVSQDRRLHVLKHGAQWSNKMANTLTQIDAYSHASEVSNRRSRRWLNDRLLIELVPRLNAEEIRGLFAPPPWGDNIPLSPFCMTNVGEWDAFRNIDMDREASMIKALSSTKRKDHVDTDKMVALKAWHRVDCRTREALRRNFLSELVEGFEECVRMFAKEGSDGDVLVMHVQDPFHRLLLHGICEFYDLVSVTVTRMEEVKLLKATRIKKKKSGCRDVPNMTLTHFLKMVKEETVGDSS